MVWPKKKGDAIETFKLPSAKEGLKYVHQIQQVNEKKIGITISHVFQFDETGAGYFLKNFSSTLKAYNGMFAWQENEDNLWTYKIFYPQYLYKITNDRFISDSVDISSYAIKKVYKMIGYNGSYWAGTDKGIIRFQKDKSSFIKNLNGEPFGQVFDFLVDKKNRLWMATETGLFICENDQITPVPKNGTQGGNYCTAITMDDKERIWAATWDGIFVTDGVKKTYFNTIDGLPSKTINCILFDNSAHKIYAGTDNGLAVLNKDAFEVVRPSYRSFSVCKLASDSSLVKYIPDGISLPPSQNDLIFHLSVPYYQDYENIKYEYRLDKNAWTSTASPEITLNDIGSGKHLFYSRVRVNGSIITSEDAVFSFSIQTRFYENWWFWLIVALLLQFILFRVINQYNKKAREKKLAVKMQEADYASLKQQAFTSLMNPHFIFNALNSVQHYINQQDRQSANKYLSDFATLIRRGFDSAQKSFVTLEEELETIRLYLQLEKMRFAGKFDYTINLSKEAEAEDWMLPSMVLQPFLENAILHGLMPLSEKGHLIIDVATQHNSLYITIADNGVGIEKSKALHSGNRHKSRGMQLIKERLELLSKLGKEPISLSIGELYPGAANPGTRIRLIIPQELYETIHKQRTQS
jgi:anti-sigma regulatory factor (Ser/Thr protein kinase)